MPYVVTSPSAEGTVALVAPVTTWQAYNEWGGYSLYAGANGDSPSHAVSFDRPYNGATGANDYRTAAHPDRRARRERPACRCRTSPTSTCTPPRARSRAPAATSRWGTTSTGPTTMRDVVLGARDAGTNLAFLGANTMYWRIRLEPGPRARPAWSSATGTPRTSTRCTPRARLEATAPFREPPVPRPEHDLLGMQYECYPVDTDYVVASPGWWGFRGTGVRRGDHVHGLVGPEADRVYPDGRLPRPLQVLSHSPYSCRGVTTTTQSVYYTTGSGAGVFNAGTLRWGCAMVDRCERPLGDGDAAVHPDRDRHTGRRSSPAGPSAPGTRPATTSTTSTSPRSTRSRRVETARERFGHDERHGPPTTPRGVAPRASASAVAPAAALAAGCSTGSPPDDEPTPTAESAALRVQTVSGAERLDEQHPHRSRGAGRRRALRLRGGGVPRRVPAPGVRPGRSASSPAERPHGRDARHRLAHRGDGRATPPPCAPPTSTPGSRS